MVHTGPNSDARALPPDSINLRRGYLIVDTGNVPVIISYQYPLWSGIVTANFGCQFDKPDMRKLQLTNWLCKVGCACVCGGIFLITSGCRRGQPILLLLGLRAPAVQEKELNKPKQWSQQAMFLDGLCLSSYFQVSAWVLSGLPSQGHTITCKLQSVLSSTSCFWSVFYNSHREQTGIEMGYNTWWWSQKIAGLMVS